MQGNRTSMWIWVIVLLKGCHARKQNINVDMGHCVVEGLSCKETEHQCGYGSLCC